eukprot:gene8124-14840_t
MGSGQSSKQDKAKQEQQITTELKRILQETHYELLKPAHIIKKLEEHFQAKLSPEQRDLIEKYVKKAMESHFKTQYRD